MDHISQMFAFKTTFSIYFFAVLLTLAKINAHQEEDHDHAPIEDHVHKEDIEKFSKKNPDEMDEDELRFYQFKQHDKDGDDKLDGLELYFNVQEHFISKIAKHERKAQEALAENDEDRYKRKMEKVESVRNDMEEEQVIPNVDTYMERFDLNDDGYISYQEYYKIMFAEKDEDSSKL